MYVLSYIVFSVLLYVDMLFIVAGGKSPETVSSTGIEYTRPFLEVLRIVWAVNSKKCIITGYKYEGILHYLHTTIQLPFLKCSIVRHLPEN